MRPGQSHSVQACKYIEENLAIRVDSLGKDALINCAKTCISSKIIGAESDFFSKVRKRQRFRSSARSKNHPERGSCVKSKPVTNGLRHIVVHLAILASN
jgi:hypothetical protein